MNQPLEVLAGCVASPTKAQLRDTRSGLDTFLTQVLSLNELRYVIQLPNSREKDGATQPQYAPA